MKPTLLIADGDAELCELYQQFLTEHGYEVETASDGLDCLRKLREETPDALLLDLELLWGGGDGVLAWLHEESPKHDIPVIVTATAGYLQDFAEFFEATKVASLPKPFSLKALLESVRAAIARRERSEPSDLNRTPRYAELFIG